ncbi:hypothetical protein ACQPYA_24710 [Micromonospora sp. CA-263727]|uniref:hypothetical protein n=1 Tax=Micromonospora sp. CA-263727 TaxID=3239967 RepID=UPI003D8BA214
MPASRKSRKSRTTRVPALTPADLAKAAATDPPGTPVALTPPGTAAALTPPGPAEALTPPESVALTPPGSTVALTPPGSAGLATSVEFMSPVGGAPPVDRAAQPKGGPPASGRGKGLSPGRPQRAGQGRQYAFRRS